MDILFHYFPRLWLGFQQQNPGSSAYNIFQLVRTISWELGKGVSSLTFLDTHFIFAVCSGLFNPKPLIKIEYSCSVTTFSKLFSHTGPKLLPLSHWESLYH